MVQVDDKCVWKTPKHLQLLLIQVFIWCPSNTHIYIYVPTLSCCQDDIQWNWISQHNMRLSWAQPNGLARWLSVDQPKSSKTNWYVHVSWWANLWRSTPPLPEVSLERSKTVSTKTGWSLAPSTTANHRGGSQHTGGHAKHISSFVFPSAGFWPMIIVSCPLKENDPTLVTYWIRLRSHVPYSNPGHERITIDLSRIYLHQTKTLPDTVLMNRSLTKQSFSSKWQGNNRAIGSELFWWVTISQQSERNNAILSLIQSDQIRCASADCKWYRFAVTSVLDWKQVTLGCIDTFQWLIKLCRNNPPAVGDKGKCFVTAFLW